MVLSARIERATCSLGGSRSIQLSYESTFLLFDFFNGKHRKMPQVPQKFCPPDGISGRNLIPR